MSVLLNSKEGALTRAFQDNAQANSVNQGYIELQKTLVTFIRGLPGNDRCCDCGSKNGTLIFHKSVNDLASNYFIFPSIDATWLSTNFGIIICIECSGIHREMGVHISKIQSLTLDNIGTSQLLIARIMSNEGFNKIMEARMSSKLLPNSSMEERKAYIKAKYEEKKFTRPYCNGPQEVYCDLEQAIDSHSMFDLLQAFGEASHHGVDITDPLPSSVSLWLMMAVGFESLLKCWVFYRSSPKLVFIMQYPMRRAIPSISWIS